MITPCPHCQAEIEIDPATLAALQGQEHFPCPACEALVATPSVSRAPVKVTATAAIRPDGVAAKPSTSTVASAHQGLNRNLLILGSAALLVLGGLGFFIASRSSGDTTTVNQDIRNEIINNTYFQQLIASGATTESALRKMEMIFPHKGGFIGISGTPLTWSSARDLGDRTASVIMPFDSSDTSANRELLRMIEPSAAGQSLWVSMQGVCAILSEAGTAKISSQRGSRKALFRWDSQVEADEGDPADSKFDPQIPEPDAEGWITLFDGEKLYGCPPEHVLVAQDRIKIENGILIIDDIWLAFALEAKNLAIRADVKKVSGINLGISLRAGKREGGFQNYSVWYNGGGARGSDFGFGTKNPNFRPLRGMSAGRNYTDFFRLEFIAIDSELTLKVEDAVIGSINNNAITTPGGISVRALRGASHFKSIQVKILDDAP